MMCSFFGGSRLIRRAGCVGARMRVWRKRESSQSDSEYAAVVIAD